MDLFSGAAQELVPLNQVVVPAYLKDRLPTGVPAIDRAFGGDDRYGFGLVKMGVVLLGGQPGAGKTTLLLQLLNQMAQKGVHCAYNSAEESQAQLKMTSERIGVEQNSNLFVGNLSGVEQLSQELLRRKTQLVVVDSIQGFYVESLKYRPGSTSAQREACNFLIRFSKDHSIPMILICQLDGQNGFKGPRDLEHNVDATAMLYGKDPYDFRILNFGKNRFGPTQRPCILSWAGGRYDFNIDPEVPEATVLALISNRQVKKTPKPVSPSGSEYSTFQTKEGQTGFVFRPMKTLDLSRKVEDSPINVQDRAMIFQAVDEYKDYQTQEVSILAQLLYEMKQVYKQKKLRVCESDADIFNLDNETMIHLLQTLTQHGFSLTGTNPWTVEI